MQRATLTPTGSAPGVVVVPTSFSRVLPALPLIMLYVVAVGGRFTLDRAGFDQFQDVDLSVVGGGVLALVVLLWRLDPVWMPLRSAWPGSTRLAVVLTGYLMLTALWAPPGARIVELGGGLLVLALLVTCVPALFGTDPEWARRLLLWAMLISGVVYAVAALTLGETDVQGRATAFGGGANVFARIVCLGALAAVALAAVYSRRWLMGVVPLVLVAAMLSGSRGAFVAMAATVVVYVVVFARRTKAQILGPLALIVGAGALIAGLFMRDRLDAIVQDRFLSAAAAGDTDYSGRPALLDEAWRIFLERPLSGSGMDSFRVLYGATVDLDYPHNIVAEIATSGGLIGIALFAAFLIQWFLDLQAVRLTTTQVALVLATVFMLTSSMFSGDFYDTRFFWIFAAASVAPSVPWVMRRGSTSVTAGPDSEARP